MRFVSLLATAALLATALLSGCNDPAGPVATSGAVLSSCADLIKNANGSNTGHTKVAFSTSKGNFTAELFDRQSPITVNNFKTYVNERFYEGVVFHRIIKDFMVQTGGYDAAGNQKETHAAIKNEAKTSGCKNLSYTLSMARTNVPDSATSQFFINTNDNSGPTSRSNLDPGGVSPDGYAVFGVVFEGRTVVDSIEATPVEACATTGERSCPTEDVLILSVRVI